jgi:hypothetical protein
MLTDSGPHMPATENKAGQPETKSVGWRIPEPLRRRLNSHSEYLSVEKETPTEAMVAQWLEERVQIEERKRALETLGIDEKDLPRTSRK